MKAFVTTACLVCLLGIAGCDTLVPAPAVSDPAAPAADPAAAPAPDNVAPVVAPAAS